LFSDFTLLHYLNYNSVLCLTADASDIGVGAVLEQTNKNGEREPLGYFSAKLREIQQRWPTYDRELYALYAATQHFEHVIQGSDLVLVTDHKPLIYMFKQLKTCKLQRRARQIDYLAQHTDKIIHVSGVENAVADYLSRPEPQTEAVSVIEAEPVDITPKGSQSHSRRTLSVKHSVRADRWRK